MEWIGAIANASGWAAAVSVLVFVIRAISKGELVSGEVHRHALKEAAWWRDRALSGTALAEVATDVAEVRAGAE